jgi:hypothetical protein
VPAPAFIADLCHHCNRITRCQLLEQVGLDLAGVVFGIPLVLPMSSVSVCCCECGFEFRSASENSAIPVSLAEAASLDIEALLSRTNPVLKERVTFPALKALPQLKEAFRLLDGLMPGRLRTGLKDALLQWSSLDTRHQDRLLAKVDDCSRALEFARVMAGRYRPFGLVGCLAGLLGCVGAWAGCVLVFGTDLKLSGWGAVFAAGLLIGGGLLALFGANRDVRWTRSVLVPEAERSGVSFAALLAVLEGAGSPHLVEDELKHLRSVATAIRAATAGKGLRPFRF